MKTIRVLFFPLLLALQSCCWYGDCVDDHVDGFYSSFEPVYLLRSELESSVELKEAQPIINSGKIYIKDNLLFVGEKRQGFHVFDNSDPANPVKVNFLSVPGSTDLAVRNSVLYLNQATDLVTARFDLDNNTLSVTKRIENTFPELYSPDGYYPLDLPEDAIVIDWKLKN